MDQQKAPAKNRKFDYPADTVGSRGAAEARARTNQLSEEKIDELYELAKKIAYGGDAQSKVGPGHKHSAGSGRGT